MVRPPIAAVAFDLGGVLADFGGVARMRALAGVDSDEEVWRRWLTCEWVRAFERGDCSAGDFAAGVVSDWSLPISPAAFLESFRSWIAAPYPGAHELVLDVKQHCRVGCLSNTNPVHWEDTASQWELFDVLDFRVLSFEVGLVKPDPEVFDHLCATVALPPEQVAFLDDNALNVDAAGRAGLQARVVRGVTEARRALEGLGVLA